MRDADTAAHAGGSIDYGESVIHGNRRELTMIGAGCTGGTQVGVHLGQVPRRGEHGRAVAVRLHRPAAAGTAVADGVEASQQPPPEAVAWNDAPRRCAVSAVAG
jgi:hypothetical protein